MSAVVLVSGGLDSTVACVLAAEIGLQVFPLFVDYGQRAAKKELSTCRLLLRRRGLPKPAVLDIRGYGRLIPSGLTSLDRDVFLDAFLPCRNLLFLLAGSAYAYVHRADAVVIGLLDERTSIFPDQSRVFLERAEELLSLAMDRPIRVVAPLMGMTKNDIVSLAREKGISGTWSCHVDGPRPCGYCVACREYLGVRE